MQINPYLSFDGECEAAFKFYERCLGGKIESLFTHEAMPPEAKAQMPGVDPKRIMHAHLSVGDQAIMGADGPPGGKKPQGFSVSLTLKSVSDGKRVFDELAQGGQVLMPFAPTFWSPGFGMLTDRFGIPWMVNCEQAA